MFGPVRVSARIYVRVLARCAGLIGLIALAACSSNGPPAPPAIAQNTPPPAAPSPPSPPPSNFDTPEFRANSGLAAIGAIPAYQAGATGDGITVAVIDTGIDVDHADLVGNISPFSTDVVARTLPTVSDPEGHGTNVAGIIAAVRNDIGLHGVAFEASVVALRADSPGTCPTDCLFADTDLTTAVDAAVAAGARVINLSLGGDAATPTLQAAFVRAINAGAVIVISAGNDGEADPTDFAMFATNPQANGAVIIAGATTSANQLAGFSNRAGSAQAVYLSAPGQNLRTTHVGGGFALVSGTSFAAPHIAGAAALLFDLFPMLTPQEVVQILLESASDLGLPGTDATFGHGLLNLAAAVAPQGPLSIPTGGTGGQTQAGGGGNQGVSAVTATGISLGPAFGDALGRGGVFDGVLGFDSFGRTYHTDLGVQVAPSRRAGLQLEDLLDSRITYRGADLALADNQALSLSLTERSRALGGAPEALPMAAQMLAPEPRVRGVYHATAGDRLAFSVAQGFTADQIVGGDRSAVRTLQGFLATSVSPTSFAPVGVDSRAAAVAHVLSDRSRLDFSVATGRLDGDRDAELVPERNEARRTTASARYSHSLGPALVEVQFGAMIERGAVLGSRSAGALDMGQAATTSFIGLSGRWDATRRISLVGQFLRGFTRIEAGPSSLFDDLSTVHSSSFSAAVVGSGLFRRGDTLAVGVIQPLRVSAGTARFAVPVAHDLDSGSVIYEQRTAGLSPSGRELDVELSYRLRMPGGLNLEANVLHQFNAGHIAGGADDTTVLVRAARRF